MRHIYYWLLALLLSGTDAGAQFQPLRVGDQLPSLVFSGVGNTGSGQLDLAAQKGKLVILDFWSTSCFTCLEDFPRLDSLQRQFGDSVQFIAVTAQSADSISRFLKRFKKLRLPSFPSITGDSLLIKLFPASSLPQHVWVNKAGQVEFITFHWSATQRRIRTYLDGTLDVNTEIMAKRKDTLIEPIVDAMRADVRSYSLLTNHNVNYGTPYSLQSSIGDFTRPNQMAIDHESITGLYTIAFNEGDPTRFRYPGNVVLEDLSLFEMQAPTGHERFPEWIKRYSFNYYIQVPPTHYKSMYKRMQKDLSMNFNIDARLEKRKIAVLELVRTSRIDKLKSGGSSTKNIYRGRPKNTYGGYLHNFSMHNFIDWCGMLLEQQGWKQKIIDKTGYTERVDMALPASFFENITLSGLRKALHAYDLDLRPVTRITTVLVLKKRKGTASVLP